MLTAYESLHEALRQVVQAAGGSKAVGARMFPAASSPQRGAQRVTDSLNPEHQQHFSDLELVLLLKIGREVGCHDAMAYLAASLGYSKPEPVETQDELQQLQRDFIAHAAALQHMSARIETITARAALHAVS